MNESDNIIDRINSFIEERNLTRSQFADACGIPRPTISQMLSGKNKKIGDDVISVIHKTYPEIPMMWLLFGEGEKPKFCASDQACEGQLLRICLLSTSCRKKRRFQRLSCFLQITVLRSII